MKLFYSALFVLFFSILIFGDLEDKKVIKPDNASNPITTIVAGKNRTYYSLSSKNATVISVKGAGEFKIITRARFTNSDPNEINYFISYRVDGGKKNKVEFNGIKRSLKAIYKNQSLGIPGDEGIISFNLGAGEHNIKVWLESSDPKVAARFTFTPKKIKKKSWVSLTPTSKNEPVNLISNEDEILYYRFTDEKAVKLNITGPTKLKFLVRVENDYSMKGRTDYRLQIKEDSKIKNTYQLSSVHSQTTRYLHDNSKIPGKANEIVIDVPKGKHTYQLSLLDKNKCTVLCRILFPKKDIKNESKE